MRFQTRSGELLVRREGKLLVMDSPARQVSARGGELYCEHRGERVMIASKAARYLEGGIFL